MQSDLTLAMMEWFQGDPPRIQHFLKVKEFSLLIAEKEGAEPALCFTLECAALTHDIGIRPAEEKYGSCGGELQQTEGPPAARALLNSLHYDPAVIERVCWLIAHHHTYSDIQGLDYQILVEADFLVNLYEDGLPPAAVEAARDAVFRTETGLKLLDLQFGKKKGAQHGS